jgi:ribosomal protein L31
MKKNIHPISQKTLIILKDKSTFKISWVFFKKKINLNVDFLNWIKY